LQKFCAHFSESQRFIELAVGQQSGVGRDLAAQELELQPTVKTNPQIVLFGVTHAVPLAPWHDLAEYTCFSRV
jgi:hypothetical protein